MARRAYLAIGVLALTAVGCGGGESSKEDELTEMLSGDPCMTVEFGEEVVGVIVDAEPLPSGTDLDPVCIPRDFLQDELRRELGKN